MAACGIALATPAWAGPCVGQFTYDGPAVTTCTISAPGYYQVSAYGADGGSGASDGQVNRGGNGAYVSGVFLLAPGTLDLLVGGKGADAAKGAGGGGGGGSFIYESIGSGEDAFLDTLLVAGGGGGGGARYVTYPQYSQGYPGQRVESRGGRAHKGGPLYGPGYQGGAGGFAGTGGAAAGTEGRGAGGGGLSGNGGGTANGAQGGRSLTDGGAGGTDGTPGGFGGGGAGSANLDGFGGGGGGGYSGGGGGGVAQVRGVFGFFLVYGGGGGGSSTIARTAMLLADVAGGNDYAGGKGGVASGNGAILIAPYSPSQGGRGARPRVTDVPEPWSIAVVLPALAALLLVTRRRGRGDVRARHLSCPGLLTAVVLATALLGTRAARAMPCVGSFDFNAAVTAPVACSITSPGDYVVTAFGADGGSGSVQTKDGLDTNRGGFGAYVSAVLLLAPGELYLVVGGKGADGVDAGGGGGGGSFVYQSVGTGPDRFVSLRVAAGAGGGGGAIRRLAADVKGGNGRAVGRNAQAGGPDNGLGSYGGGAAGRDGSGGGVVQDGGGGGAGFTGNGAGGTSVTNGASGGVATAGAAGGFGGGGAGGAVTRRFGDLRDGGGGGGGGYSGGGGGGTSSALILQYYISGFGGGGSSYVTPGAMSYVSTGGANDYSGGKGGVESGNGYISIEPYSPAVAGEGMPSVTDVPEPAGAVLLLPALIGILVVRRGNAVLARQSRRRGLPDYSGIDVNAQPA